MTPHNHASRILRIGLVNSGMFDLLELNLDVQAVHLIGENNVGKTSLIALIQFLYFHDVREMTFSKPSPESLAFYFNRAGSYVLFEVRTLNQTRRTVGVYGTGTASSRAIFVFDGGFELEDFMDEERRVVPLDQAQPQFFNRNFRRFDRFQDYERALIGQHTDGAANVQLFDLDITSFRSLRKLLQGLLKLDHIAAEDIRAFLISRVRTGGAATEIDVVADYEAENREIQHLQHKLLELQILQPIIAEWQSLTAQQEKVEQDFEAEKEKLYHISTRYLESLATTRERAQTIYRNTKQQKELVGEQLSKQQRAHAIQERQIEELQQDIGEFKRLEDSCADHSRVQVEARRDKLIHQRIELENTLQAIQPDDLGRLERQQRQLEQERMRVLRQLEQRTLSQVWREAEFTAEEQALLNFLLAEDLLSLPAVDVLADTASFLAAARQAVGRLDEVGTFHGFGLTIPRATWYHPPQESVSLIERRAQIEEDLERLDARIEVAADRTQKEADLQVINQNIKKAEGILGQFENLRRLRAKYRSLEGCREQLGLEQAEHAEGERRIQKLKARVRALEDESERSHARVVQVTADYEEADGAHRALQRFETPCPPEIERIIEDDLKQEYRHSRDQAQRTADRLQDLQRRSAEPRLQLEDRYERAGSEMSFEAWLARQQDVAQQIAKIEAQISDIYQNLFTRIRSELSKLIQAFEEIKGHIAALNNIIRQVQVSNIEKLAVTVQESELIKAIRETAQRQLDLFSSTAQTQNFEEAQNLVDDYLAPIRTHGSQLQLSDLFNLEFSVTFAHDSQPRTVAEIHNLESHGTEIGVKVVLYLGLIRLLQSKRNTLNARVPFFLDEVGSIDEHNLKELIAYSDQNNFLPIFASPSIRQDIAYNYIFRRTGERSQLVNEIIIMPESERLTNGPA